MGRAAHRLFLVLRDPLGMAVELVFNRVAAYRIDNAQPIVIASVFVASS